MISGSTWYKTDSTLNEDEKEEYDKVGLKDWYLTDWYTIQHLMRMRRRNTSYGSTISKKVGLMD